MPYIITMIPQVTDDIFDQLMGRLCREWCHRALAVFFAHVVNPMPLKAIGIGIYIQKTIIILMLINGYEWLLMVINDFQWLMW